MVSKTLGLLEQMWHAIAPAEKASQDAQKDLHDVMQEIEKAVDEERETVTEWQKARKQKRK